MIWFPTSMGRFYQHEDFGLVGAVADLIEAGIIQVACVDSVDAEALHGTHRAPAERLARHAEYDRYLSHEVVPWIRAKTRTQAKLATLGASLGGFHAVNFAFRHPDAVAKVVGLSGKYDIHSYLDGYWDDNAYFHCPTAYVPNMNPQWVHTLSQLDISIVSGATDNILGESQQLIRILEAKRIPHRGDIWAAPYGHDWPWWNVQIGHYLP